MGYRGRDDLEFGGRESFRFQRERGSFRFQREREFQVSEGERFYGRGACGTDGPARRCSAAPRKCAGGDRLRKWARFRSVPRVMHTPLPNNSFV